MTDLRIDYSDLHGFVDEAEKEKAKKGRRRDTARALPGRLLQWLLAVVVVAIFPFVLLIRGGVLAYQVWGLGTWPALALSVLASSLLLGGYAWLAGRKLGAGRGARRVLTRGAIAATVAYVAYGLVFIASENVKSDEIRAEYSAVHPLLRLAASALVLVDPESVVTDAGRTPEDYWLMGLPTNEASLHFEQETGFVHALDLRTQGRSELRNRSVELGFWMLGFHSLRHVGTADHLHLSLRLPG